MNEVISLCCAHEFLTGIHDILPMVANSHHTNQHTAFLVKTDIPTGMSHYTDRTMAERDISTIGFTLPLKKPRHFTLSILFFKKSTDGFHDRFRITKDQI